MMFIRPSVSKDASSLAILSLEVWSTTYLRRGINAFFAKHALEEFSRPRFEAVLCDPFEILLVAEIKTLYVRPWHHHRGIGKA